MSFEMNLSPAGIFITGKPATTKPGTQFFFLLVTRTLAILLTQISFRASTSFVSGCSSGSSLPSFLGGSFSSGGGGGGDNGGVHCDPNIINNCATYKQLSETLGPQDWPDYLAPALEECRKCENLPQTRIGRLFAQRRLFQSNRRLPSGNTTDNFRLLRQMQIRMRPINSQNSSTTEEGSKYR